MKMKLETVLGLVFCLGVVPLLMFIFPLEEWAGWHARYILVFTLWLYGVYFLNAKITAPLLMSGMPKLWTGIGLVFLETALTFLMSLQEVAFPKDFDLEKLPRLEAWQQAIWILYIVVAAFSLTLGLMAVRIHRLEGSKQLNDKEKETTNAIRFLGPDAVAGEHITVKSDYSDSDIPLSAIQYIESRNNYACFHLDHREDIVTQTSLKALMETLPEGKFLRIHRSYVIPAFRIESRRADEVKLYGVDAPLPVGRAYKDNLK